MRNHYESEIGHFEGAVLPEAETFKEELPMVLEKLKGQEDRKILLYCTGGIRCEKTSAYLKHHGFNDVNQLHGGIIDYARQIEEEALDNKFHGINFVFDERLGEEISCEVISECHQCGEKSARHTNCANKACNCSSFSARAVQTKTKDVVPAMCEVINLPEEEQHEIRRKAKKTKRFHRHSKVNLRDAFKEE